MSVLVALALVGIGWAGTAFWAMRAWGVLRLMALVPLLGIPAFLPGAVLEREGHFRRIALAQSAANIAGGGATIGMALAGFSFMSAAYGQVANAAVMALLLVASRPALARPRLGLQGWRRVAGFAGQMLAISGFPTWECACPTFCWAAFWGWGNWACIAGPAASTCCSGPTCTCWRGACCLWISRISCAGAKACARAICKRWRCSPPFCGRCLPAGGAGRACHRAGVRRALVPARGALAWLALASILQVAITMTNELFAATGKLHVQTRIEFIRAGIALALFVAGCLVSIEAAAAARAAEAFVAVLLYRRQVCAMTDTTPADLAPIYRAATLITLATCLPALAASAWWGFSPQMPLGWVAGATLAGALWLAALAALDHPLWREIRRRLNRSTI
jgi:O-antigen/teichoic acid export membrane protein